MDFGSFLIPRTDYRIDDVWHVVGLKGTGSNTVVVKDVFVPRHRFLSYKSMNDRTAGGLENNTAPVYKMPWGTVHPTTISAPDHGAWRTAPTTHTSNTRASACARRSPARSPRTTRSPRSASPSRQRHRRGLASADGQRR